jgi:hypothetical protein
VHPLLTAVADRQWGVFTAADVRRAGYGSEEVRNLLSTGTWVRLRRGVYASADHLARGGSAHARECLAVLLAAHRPDAAVSHASAARLLGVRLPAAVDRVVRLTDPERWREGRGFRIARAPLPVDEVVRREPLRLTSIARTLVDCAREWVLEDAVVAMDAALLDDRTTAAELRAAVGRQRHWPGAPRAVRAVSLADGRAESPLETLGRLKLVGAELRPTDLQVEIRVAGRLVAVADAWYEAAAVALEFDGKVKYTDRWRGRDPRQVLWEEKRREDEVRALGIRVVRVVDADLGPRWAALERRLRGLVATAGPPSRVFTATPRERGRRRSA